MKKIENYSTLWQKKRSEWHVDGNASADWAQMRSVLDSQMPSSGLIKKPYNPGKLKLLYKLFIGFSAAVTVYGGAHYYFGKKHNNASRDASVKETRITPSPKPGQPAPINQVVKVESNKQVPKPAVIKAGNKLDRVYRSVGSVVNDSARRIDGTNLLTPHDVKNTGTVTVTDSLKKAPELIKGNITLHRDSTLLPGKSGHINNKATDKAKSDSLNKVKKKRRFKIGIFT